MVRPTASDAADLDLSGLPIHTVEDDLNRLERVGVMAVNSIHSILGDASRPPELPEIPLDVTRLDTEAIAGLMSHLTAWIAYAESQAAEAEAHLLRTEAALDWQRSSAYLTLRNAGVKRAEAELKAEIELQPAIRRATLTQVEYQARVKLLKARLRTFDQQYTLLSRELTRRGIGLSQVGKG